MVKGRTSIRVTIEIAVGPGIAVAGARPAAGRGYPRPACSADSFSNSQNSDGARILTPP